MKFLPVSFTVASLLALGCSSGDAQPKNPRSSAPTMTAPADEPALDRHAATPYIPPQCYTKTTDEVGGVHNPCFACHVDGSAPNYIRDGALQLGYDFAPPALENPWTNLFVDRRAEVALISDEAMLAYVRENNYAGLVQRLEHAADWDADGDGAFTGFVPDLRFSFDAEGYDRTENGDYTGWRTYAYYPLPGAFWPTNGSFGDAMVRLPEAYRTGPDGARDLTVYAVNLAIVESMISRRDVPIPPTDERALDVDLDGDGKLSLARLVRHRFAQGVRTLRWAGAARDSQHGPTPGLFPVGTELAHSLRYLDVADGKVRMARRMKELRYMRKVRWVSYGTLEQHAVEETAEKSSSPDKTRLLIGDSEHGMDNGAGWRLAGFIEDAQGELRPQTREEHAFCIGCHSGVGATDDSVFSFGRKLARGHTADGWFHASEGLAGVPEPRRGDGAGEYATYLARNGAGDELRQNEELAARFFEADGKLATAEIRKLSRDVSALLLPSPARALLLDKAYRVIVREQSYVRGRDATLTPAENVHRRLPAEGLETGISDPMPERRQIRARSLASR